MDASNRHRQTGRSNYDIAANCDEKIAVSLIGIYHKGEECFSRFDWLVKRRLANTSHLRAARETKSRVNLSVSKRIVVD